MSFKKYKEWNLDCKVYIGNLSEMTSKLDIENAFSKYGPLKNVWVARNPPGFAFVEYEDNRDAEDAVRGLDGTRIAGSRVRVEMSHGRSRRPSHYCSIRRGNSGREYREDRDDHRYRSHRKSRSRSRSPSQYRSKSRSPVARRSRLSRSGSRSRKRSVSRNNSDYTPPHSARSPPPLPRGRSPHKDLNHYRSKSISPKNRR